MKSKYVAAALAFFLGIFGVHRFYLGRRFLGILHFALFWICFIITKEDHEPALMFPAIWGFIDAVLLFVMPKEEFDERYNRKWLRSNTDDNWEGTRRGEPRRDTRPRSLNAPGNRKDMPSAHEGQHFKRLGIEKFRDYDYEGAIDAFEKALEAKYEDPATHFNLACCHSILESADEAFLHLEEAFRFGFADKEKVETHDALAFVRTQPNFEAFIKNGYKRPEPEPGATPQAAAPSEEAEPDLLEALQQPIDDLLEQIVKLGKLRDKGVLTEEEFVLQKKKILGE